MPSLGPYGITLHTWSRDGVAESWPTKPLAPALRLSVTDPPQDMQVAERVRRSPRQVSIQQSGTWARAMPMITCLWRRLTDGPYCSSNAEASKHLAKRHAENAAQAAK